MKECIYCDDLVDYDLWHEEGGMCIECNYKFYDHMISPVDPDTWPKNMKKLWEVHDGETGFVSCADCVYAHLTELFNDGKLSVAPVLNEKYLSDGYYAAEDFFGEHGECNDHRCSGCEVRLVV